MAGLIRVMRETLLDELRKPYVVAARARGVSELSLLLKYPVWVAINLIVSTISWTLPQISLAQPSRRSSWGCLQRDRCICKPCGRKICSCLAGSFTMFLTALTIIGTFISDILLAWLDPRIRIEE